MSSKLPLYRAEAPDALIVRPLDAMTLIYQRRSGITHMVAEPVPEILEAMDSGAIDAEALAGKLAEKFDLGANEDAVAVITDRLEELAELGLVERLP